MIVTRSADAARPAAARGWGLVGAMALLARPTALLLIAGLAGALLFAEPAVLALPIVWALLGLLHPADDRVQLPGRAVRPADEPELAILVGGVAELLGLRAPLLVRVLPTADAALVPTKVSGVRGYALLLGLPLLRRLSAEELAAVVAHEIAHAQNSAHRRDRLLAATRDALVDSLGNRIRLPRAVAARLLRATQPYIWQAEVAADARSAEVAGTAAARDALRQSSLIVTAFDYLAAHWVSVLAQDGDYPADLYEAFDAALDDPNVVRRMAELLADEEAVDAFAVASHPPLDRRLAALPDRRAAGVYDSQPLALRQADELKLWCARALTVELQPRRRGGGGNANEDEDEDELCPVRVLDTAPERFDSSAENTADLMRATGRDTAFAAVAAAVDAVADGSWPRLAQAIEPAVGAAPRPLRAAASRDVLVGCLGQEISALLRDAGWERASRWTTSVVDSPAGETVDVREWIQRALDGGDPGQLRALLTTLAPAVAS